MCARLKSRHRKSTDGDEVGLNEFDLIKRFFNRPAPEADLGVGDDCSLFTPSPGMQLACSVDMLVQGQHFFPDVDPFLLGHKALAVNLSDLGAMGARPRACFLALSLPEVNTDWLHAFSDGFYRLADQAQCPLLGGDTTRSPQGVVISVTVMGQVRAEQALRRSAAKPEDDIWVTGYLGAADIALKQLLGQMPRLESLLTACRPALEEPWPPYQFGAALAGVAHAAIDISDGLLQDLGHVLKASHCGARIDYDRLPVATCLAELPIELQEQAVLSGGDVFELCFTAPARQRAHIQALAAQHGVLVHRIGQVYAGHGVQLYDRGGVRATPLQGGFDHFSADK